LNKNDFNQDTRYTATLRDEAGKLRPANFYVMRLHDDGMVVRMTDKAAKLLKLKYEDIIKIVATKAIATQNRYGVPDALLSEAHWKGKTVIDHYSTAPHMGK